MTLAANGEAGFTPARRRRRVRRETLWALAAALALNAALLALLLLGDRSGTWIVRAPREVAVRLDLFRPPARTPARPREPEATKAIVKPSEPRPPQPVPPPPVAPSPAPAREAIPAPFAPQSETAPDAAVQARAAAALRALSACSRLGGRSDEDQAECARQLAVHRDQQIDAVPSQMRAQQAAAEAHRAYVMSGAAAALLPTDPPAPIRGPNISVHYKCSMKFGANASGKMHCPGVN